MSGFNFCPASLISSSQTNFSHMCLQSASLYANGSQFQYICSVIYSFPIPHPLTVSVLSPTESQFSSLPPICTPAPHSIFLSFEDLFQTPPTTSSLNFLLPIRTLQSHFLISLSHSTWCVPFSLWSSNSLPPHSSPVHFVCAWGRCYLEYSTYMLFAFSSSVRIQPKPHSSPEINAEKILLTPTLQPIDTVKTSSEDKI